MLSDQPDFRKPLCLSEDTPESLTPSCIPPKTEKAELFLVLFFVILVVFLPLDGYGQDPAGSPEPPSFLSLGIQGYQEFMSPVLVSHCYMLPSCSVYGKEAIAEHGPLLGLLLTIDRLFHEANEDQTSPMVRQGNQLKLYDPPSANIWWIRKK